MKSKIRMVRTAVGPDSHYLAGQEYEVSDELARAFIRAGAAIADPALASATETAERPAAPETTAKATKRRAPRKRTTKARTS